MHAGDALWKLYAFENMLGNPEMLECCNVIGKLIGVPPPNAQQLQSLVQQIRGETRPPQSGEETPKRRNDNNRKELVEAMELMTSRMMDDTAFEWVTSGILESIHEQSGREEDPFVTPKQCAAVLNIAERSDQFMMDFEADHPDELRLVTEHARK